MEPSVFSGRVASLAVIASLVLQVSGTSLAAESRVALPSTPAADHTLSRRIGFEANCGQVDAHGAVRGAGRSLHRVPDVDGGRPDAR